MNSAALYFKFIGISIRSQMQYRASFIMLSLGRVVVTGIEFLAIAVLFDRFSALQDWQLAEVGVFYGIIHIAFSIGDAVSGGFDRFSELVRTGKFDRVLLRPRSAALQVAGYEFSTKRVGRFLQGLAVLVWSINSIGLTLSVGKLCLILFSIVGGAAVFFGIFVLQATISFWTVASLEIVNTISYGGIESAQYPLTIYHPWFRRFFTFVVPLACVNYFPAMAILDKPDPLGLPVVFQWLSPLAGFVFLVVCLKIWTFGVRHYTSTGS